MGMLRIAPVCLLSLLGLFVSASSQQAAAQHTAERNALKLIPIPRQVTPGRTVSVPHGVQITCETCATDPADRFTSEDLSSSLTDRGLTGQSDVRVTLMRAATLPDLPREAQAEGYTITPAANSLTLTATTAAGLFYAAQTVKQLIVGDGPAAVLHLATVRDWPAMRYRGMHDDLSRGPVPTLAFQEQLIRTLAAYKMNVYSPYFEHTQQYASNPLFAPPGGSISAADAHALVDFATRYHVLIIPEQEAFGHIHPDLLWEQYQPLAETPHGANLAPGQPGSLALITQEFGELAALYPGPFLHIGADETVDLGTGQTKSAVDQQGLGPVYLSFLEQIQQTLAPLDRRLLFWGDIAQSIAQSGSAADANLLRNLPAAFKQATIAVAWEYNPQPTRGFSRFLTPFTQAGIETWVAPGVNNWSAVWPDDNDALPNIQQFVAEGQREHSTGVLNTVWYDDGEALANNNWHGLLFGAAAAWQPGVSSIDAFQSAFAAVFHGDQTGALDQAQQELAVCHSILRNQAGVGNGSDGLFWMDPWSRDGQSFAVKLRPHLHELRIHAERALTLIAQARAAYPAAAPPVATGPPTYNPADALPSNPTTLHHPDAVDALELGARRMDFIGLKFQLADEIVQGYARAQTAAASSDKKLHATTNTELSNIRGINGRLRDLIDAYSLLRDLYQQAWLRSNRPYALRPVLEHYDATIQLWIARNDRMRGAQRQYANTRTLPSAADLGLPPL